MQAACNRTGPTRGDTSRTMNALPTRPPPGPVRSLRLGVALLGEDPVRLLGLGALGALLDVAQLVVWVRLGSGAWSAPGVLLGAVGVRLGLGLAVDVCVAWSAASAAGVVRAPALWVLPRATLVALLAAAVGLPLVALLALPGLIGALLVGAQGGTFALAVPLAVAGGGAWAGGLVLRGLARAALARLVVDGGGAVSSVRRALGDLGTAVVVTALCDLLRAAGTALLVAPALPAHVLPVVSLVSRRAALHLAEPA